MKQILVIGAGGIGSFFCEELNDSLNKGHIKEPIEVAVADDDIVEVNQVMYQNFLAADAGMPKSKIVGMRCGIYSLSYKITKDSQLKGYDLIVCCVDNDKLRSLVVQYCHKNNTEFIDLRSTGRKIFAMPKENTLQENMKFIDKKDMGEYSCQDKNDLEKGWIQIGNKVVATIGVQMVLNYLRGHSNRIINLII